MSYTRVIPVLLFDDGAIWRSQEFARHYRLGDPIMQLERYKVWDVDEIVYVDMHRNPNGKRLLDFLPEIARNCFAPLATGGGIRTLEDIHNHLTLGADRVVINTAAFDNPDFISQASHRYGAQAIVVSIDAKKRGDGYEVVVDSGRRPTGKAVEAFLDVVTDTLKRGGDITFTGFGKFTTQERAARTGVNPRDPSQKVDIPAARVPKFSAGSALKSAVKQR